MMPGKPPMAMMPPPHPSPAMAAKTPGGPPKPEDNGLPNGRIDASPQHAGTGIGGPGPGGIPSATNTPAPRTPNTSGTGMTAPSPSAILASTPTMSNHPPPPPPPGPGPSDLDPTMFSLNFNEFTDLDPSALMGEGVDFERDFAAWFNPGPDNAGGP